MKISEHTLSKFIEVKKGQDLGKIINGYICEAEQIIGSLAQPTLVCGHVLTCEEHPDSDHLHITTVDVGSEVLDIVCGAKNIAKGQDVIVAKVGTTLPGDFQIKAAKVRGVQSNGMICSLNELGLKNVPSEYKEGIYVFSNIVKPGECAASALMFADNVYNLELTPDRGDLLSYYGFAKDLSSVTGDNFIFKTPDSIKPDFKNQYEFNVDNTLAPNYALTQAKVSVKPSPWFIQAELIKQGIEPKNNIVDISNYVMYLLGTPNHIFDAKCVVGNKVSVEALLKPETFTALDGNKYELNAGDLVIKDSNKTIALAGIIGSKDSKITEHTTDVIIENAIFLNTVVFETQKRLSLKTEASDRFSKGVSFELFQMGYLLLIELLKKYADAKISDQLYSGITKSPKHPFEFNFKKLKKISGHSYKEKDIIETLYKLGYSPRKALEDNFYTLSQRPHIFEKETELDAIDNVIRVSGLNLIKPKPLTQLGVADQHINFKVAEKIRQELVPLGFLENINYTLLSEKEDLEFSLVSEKVKVRNPITENHLVMRTNLLAGLKKSFQYNLNRKIENFNIFEVGKIFNGFTEELHCAAIISSNFAYSNLVEENKKVDFYLVKSLLNKMLYNFGISPSYAVSTYKFLHPYRQANILYQDKIIGYIGEIEFNKKKTIVFNLNLELLKLTKETPKYERISSFPRVERDLALVASVDTSYQKIVSLIKQTARKTLKEITLFDIFKNPETPDFVSYAFHLVFENTEKQIEIQDIEKTIKSILNRLAFELKVTLRWKNKYIPTISPS